MNTEEFRRRGKEMVDYMCDYMNSLHERRVTSEVQPDYLRPLIPDHAPQDPEPWDNIMADVETKIMPGVSHWQHPQFHAYFPSGTSYPSILGDMLSDTIGSIVFSWASSPACTELETIVLDWLVKAMGLPYKFNSQSKGGGVLQGSASECVLVSILAARAEALRRLHEQDQSVPEACHLPKLVAYTSNESHSCVEKAAMICLVQLRLLEPDENNSLSEDTLRKAIEEDEEKGLVPFFVSAVLGSPGSCSFDNLTPLGTVARDKKCWFHVDAAYAGSALICPEFQYLIQGIEFADSFDFNPSKWLRVTFDCSCLWVADRRKLTNALNVERIYLQHEQEDKVFDYRNWVIPLSRRFRALKLWFTLRSFGISGLQKYIRNHVQLAKRFEKHVLTDHRFEVLNDVRMGLVSFRLRGKGDKLTAELLANINNSGKLNMIPARVKDKYIIRFCVRYWDANESNIDHAWSVISTFASELLSDDTPRVLFRKMSSCAGGQR